MCTWLSDLKLIVKTAYVLKYSDFQTFTFVLSNSMSLLQTSSFLMERERKLFTALGSSGRRFTWCL